MATEKREKRPEYTSPKGPFRFPKLDKPDFGTEEYPKPDGEYSVQLVFPADSPEAQSLIKKLTPHYEEARAKAAEQFADLSVAARKKLEKKNVNAPVMNEFFTTLYDKETEEETGDIAFKFKMKASGERKKGKDAGTRWHRKPVIYDAKGNRMTKVPDIWGGTVGKVAFEVAPYFVDGTGDAGISLKLNGVQIIDLVKGGERSAESLGFTEEEGYEYDETDAAPEPKAADDEDNTATDGDETGDF